MSFPSIAPHESLDNKKPDLTHGPHEPAQVLPEGFTPEVAWYLCQVLDTNTEAHEPEAPQTSGDNQVATTILTNPAEAQNIPGVIEAARRLLRQGFRPVVLWPGGINRKLGNRNVTTSGKEPFGRNWGLKAVTDESLTSDIHYFARQGLEAGCGLCLGPGRAPGEGWLLDLEGDGPEAEESRAKILGGEVLLSMGWGSVRGGHQLLTCDSDRIREVLAKLKKHEVATPGQPGVYHFPSLPGLEIRIGGLKSDGTLTRLWPSRLADPGGH